jgi:3-oxoadipate enol-lactonase
MTMTRQLSIPVAAGRLHGEERGAGSALILLHGFSFDMSMWDPQFAEFARQYRTVRYDLRGFGRSGRPAAGRGHVADLLALLDALGIQRAHLVGLSLGANVALATAVYHPDRVHGLVLASPGLPGYRWTTSRPPDQAARVAREHGIVAAKEYWLGHEIFRSAARYPDARRRLAEMVGRFPAHQWGDGPAADPLPPLAGSLARVQAPVLVLNGSLDVPGYREIAACLHREIPGAGCHELGGTGHLLNLEQPATFNYRVVGFLTHLDGSAHALCRTGSDRAPHQRLGSGP